ncbi:MAG: hypothetical protein SGILL_006382 [Bacillariaceae sp.]
MPSPFDDIGYLATDNAPSRSINTKGSSTPWSRPTPETSNHQTSNINEKEKNKSVATGPSLNDFLQKEKESVKISPQQQQQKNAINQDIVSRTGSRLPFRRGKRSEAGNNSKHNHNIAIADDEESIGISTIASKGTLRLGSRVFEISKGSLTLSMLGASKSKHSKYNESKSRTTKTTETTSNHTKSSFGSSMFSRDTSKSKERLRVLIEQLEGANATLMSENKEARVELEKLKISHKRAALFEKWFSVQESAEVQTELAKARAQNIRTAMEKNDLQEQVKSLTESLEQIENDAVDLKAVNDAQADRIAFLEAKLLENQLDPSHHHQLVKCENAMTFSQDSLASFDTFGSLDFTVEVTEKDQSSYEEELNCKDETDDETMDSTALQSKAFKLVPDDVEPPPPPPSAGCMTDPCTSDRKKADVEKPRSARSRSSGTKKRAKQLSGVSASSASTESSAPSRTVISTSRVSARPRRSRSTPTGARAPITQRDPRISDRARRTKSMDKPSSQVEQCQENKRVPTILSRQPSRRRLRKQSSTDPLSSSQHSAKSNKSSKSNKSAKSNKSVKSSNTARRRKLMAKPLGKPLDPLGASSTHSTGSAAARRRLRNSAIAENDRGTVKESLMRIVGDDNDHGHELSEKEHACSAPARTKSQLLAPPPTNKDTPPMRRSASKGKPATTNDDQDFVQRKPIALVQDNAKTQLRDQPRIRPALSSKWAMSA